jgi:exodeoxyribonuclease V beta subunit
MTAGDLIDGAPAGPAPAAPLDLYTLPLHGRRVIEASAGTGKTWALTGLVMRFVVEAGVPLPALLVVTFTKAAVAELRERIDARLREAARLFALGEGAQAAATGDPFFAPWLAHLQASGLAPSTAAQRVHAALAQIDEASIHTIHTFCRRAVAEAPFSAAAPLAAEVEADDSRPRHGALADAWRHHVLLDRALPPPLAQHLLQRGDGPVAWRDTFALHLARPLAQRVWPAAPAGASLEGAAAAFAEVHAAFRAQGAGGLEEAAAAIAEALSQGRLSRVSYKDSSLERGAEGWREVLASEVAPLPAAAALKPMRLFAAGRLAEACNKKKDKSGSRHVPPDHVFFEAAEAWLDTHDTLVATLHGARMALLRRVLDTATARLAEHKRSAGVVSFDDMLAELHERLSGEAGEALVATMRRRWRAALVDECQDTDPLQAAILDRLAGVGAGAGTGAGAGAGAGAFVAWPLVLVGDPKQAIYAFRHADLHAYVHARAQAQGVHRLDTNQRSVPPLIAALNALWGANPRVFVEPGLEAHPVRPGQRARPPLVGAAPGRAAFEVRHLDLAEGGAEGPLRLLAEARALALRSCVDDIAADLRDAAEGRLRLGDRPLAGGDIAVLVRTHGQARRVQAALGARGIAAALRARRSVFHAVEAEELAAVLDAVLEPHDPTRVATALATDAGGWNASRLHAALSPGPEAVALADEAARFARALVHWPLAGPAAMLRRWLRESGAMARLLVLPGGERRLTNWLHLVEQLHAAATDAPTPEALRRWLDEARRRPPSGDEALLRLESDARLVQVVTIHAAKGLEFPIVHLPFAFESPASARRDRGEGLSSHDDEGLVRWDFRRPPAPAERGDPDPARTIPPAEFDALAAARRRAALAEGVRLMYVALTRAVHRCVVVAGCTGRLAKDGDVAESKPGRRGLLNWIVGDGGDPAAWLDEPPKASAALAAWRRVQAAAEAVAPGALALVPLPPARRGGVMAPASEAPARALAAPPLPAPAWRLASYSGMMRGARLDPAPLEPAARDHDERAEAAPATPAPPAALEPLADDDPLGFPRGAAAGSALHRAFEWADFTQPAGWPAAARAAVAGLALDTGAAEDAARRLVRTIDEVLATPIALPGLEGEPAPPALELRRLEPEARVAELPFWMAAPALDVQALHALVAGAGFRVPALAPGRGPGAFVQGALDAVVEHAGRCWVIDWKSNHLGPTPADYTGAALEAAMDTHGYHLQALLYALALRRHLRDRAGPAAGDAAFGGVIYLFVRGVRRGWRTAAGHACGVHVLRPAAALLDAMDRLLGGTPGAER